MRSLNIMAGLLLVGGLCGLVSGAVEAHEGDIRFGYVDVQKVLAQDSTYQKALNQWEIYHSRHLQQLEKQIADLKSRKREFMARPGEISNREYRRRLHRFELELGTLNSRLKRIRRRSKQRKHKLMTRAKERVVDTVKTLSNQLNLEFVYTNSSLETKSEFREIIWTSSSRDITEEVSELIERNSDQ